MSPRRIAVFTIAAIVALGGAVVLAKPSFLTHAQTQSLQSPNLTDISANPQRGPGDQANPGQGEPGWFKDLNLSSDQIQKIRSIRNQYKDSVAGQRKAVRQAQQELQTLMVGDASTDQLRQKYNQMKTLRQQLADAQFDSMLAIREILTPEQRRKFAEHMQDHHRGDFRDRMKERSGPQS